MCHLEAFLRPKSDVVFLLKMFLGVNIQEIKQLFSFVADAAALFPFHSTVRSISQPRRLKVLLPFAVFHLPQSMEILVAEADGAVRVSVLRKLLFV